MTELRRLDQRWFVGAWLGGHGFELGATDEADAPEQGRRPLVHGGVGMTRLRHPAEADWRACTRAWLGEHGRGRQPSTGTGSSLAPIDEADDPRAKLGADMPTRRDLDAPGSRAAAGALKVGSARPATTGSRRRSPEGLGDRRRRTSGGGPADMADATNLSTCPVAEVTA
jgi:hypothetical protein